MCISPRYLQMSWRAANSFTITANSIIFLSTSLKFNAAQSASKFLSRVSMLVIFDFSSSTRRFFSLVFALAMDSPFCKISSYLWKNLSGMPNFSIALSAQSLILFSIWGGSKISSMAAPFLDDFTCILGHFAVQI